MEKIIRSTGSFISNTPLINKNWKVTAFVLGALTGLSYAPMQSLTMLIMGFVGMLIFHRSLQLTIKDDLKFGLSFSFGFCLASLYWVAWSFKMAGLGNWMPMIVFIFPLASAAYYVPAFAVMRLFKNNPLLHGLSFVVAWSFLEFLKDLPFPTFPWGFVAYALPDTLQQGAAFFGVEGLSIITLLVIALLATRWMPLSLLLLVGGISFGHFQLKAPRAPEHPINVRLIQPSIPQQTKYARDHIETNYLKHLALSQLESEKPLDLIIWPEAAIPFALNKYDNVRMSLMEAAPEKGHIIVGALRDVDDTHVYNSVYVLNSATTVVDVYDKSHLTPFGEYMPFKRFLPFEKLTSGARDFSEGSGLRSLCVDGIPAFAVLICYESIFSNRVVPHDNVEWLLNITNDAWFGDTTGPAQHLQIVRMRAIEEGIAILRCANNGITAVIDPHGRILKKLPLNAVGYIDTHIPKKLQEPTYFSRHRHIAYWVYGIIVLLMLAVYWNQQREKIKASPL